MESSLPLVECFHSIQGEGAHAGKSAFFIRLASCQVGCEWCDTKNSWSTKNYPKVNVKKLSKEVIKAINIGADFVVITGGEPLHHDLNPLCNAIRLTCSSKGITKVKIHLETSGVDTLSGDIDWITLSPKPHAIPTQELLAACNELKVVVNKAEDIIFAEKMAKESFHAKNSQSNFPEQKVNNCNFPLLFLQPGWNNKEGESLVIEYVKKNSRWRLSLQTHKWLGVL